LDATLDEVMETFTKAGMIAKDPLTREYKAKIVTDTSGKSKGEAILKYFRPESIPIAHQIIQGFPLRLGGDPMTFETATPEQRKSILQPLKKKKRCQII